MDKPTYVYAIECAGFVKVGLAECTNERLGGLRPNCPLPMKLLARRQFPSKEAARKAERTCHRRLRNQRETGEWFMTSPLSPVDVLLEVYRELHPESPITELIDARKPVRPFDMDGLSKALSSVKAGDLWAAHQ